VVFALALIILAITIMAVGQESRLFSPKIRFRAVFPNTDGLSVGSPVKMAGVQVGTVTDIRLPIDPQEVGIEVTMGVDRAYAPRVRNDSRAALRTLQYLTGEKGVEITPGTPAQPALPEDSILERLEETPLMDQVGMASQNLSEITVSLKRILGALERGEGLMGQMITDPDFGKQTLEAVRGTFQNLQALTGDLRHGRGFIGRALHDEEFAGRIDDFGRAITGLANLVDSIDPHAGALGALLEEGGPAEQAVDDLAEAAGGLRRAVERLEGDHGLLGRLLNDPEYSEAMAADLQVTLRNLAEISDKINRGEGTLGALINERTLHDGLEDVVAGVNDSKFARWLLRHYQKKGIKQETTDPVDEPGVAPTAEEPRRQGP